MRRQEALPEPEIVVAGQVREAITRHALACQPDECCGLIATDADGRIKMVYPLTNSLASPARFTIDPSEHFGAVQHAERSGWDIGGVFHSHPDGDASLSAVDIEQPHDPDWFHFVVGLIPRVELRAWRIRDGRPMEVPLSPETS